MSVNKNQLNEIIAKDRASFVADYKRIVECPSVSAQPEHKKDIQEAARIAAELLRSAGAEVRVFETGGNPVVYGRIQNDPKAPTAAVYNHMDVQPAAKGKDGWTRDPFKFTEENGRFYARGTTDDKGPAMTALWAAKIAKSMKVPTNVEFIWEFEEEIGSPHFEEFLGKAQDTIRADSIVVSDTLWIARGKPATSLGLRGLVSASVYLKTHQKDIHSGVTGGAARNPLTELCGLVAACVDTKTGQIKIPGFEKTWTPPTKEEREDFLRAGFSAEAFKTANSIDKLRTEDSAEVASRIWAMPTFEVHGIVGGYQEAGNKTVIPPAAELKMSIRLVPGQDPKKILDLFTNYVKTVNPDCTVEQHGCLGPYAAPKDNPLVAKVKEAFEFGFGAKTASVREGGSIGAVLTMDRILKKPILFMGLSLPEDGYHGPDESFAWEQVDGGVKSFVRYFELLAQK